MKLKDSAIILALHLDGCESEQVTSLCRAVVSSLSASLRGTVCGCNEIWEAEGGGQL